MSSTYDQINVLYPELQRIKRDNHYNYKQLYETKNETIEIGVICDDENEPRPGDLVLSQKWGFPDSANTCMYNVQKTYSKALYDENKMIHGDGVTKKNGLIMKSKPFNNVNDYTIDIFDTNASEEFINSVGTTLTGKITEYFTYFCPNQSGEYTFTVQLMNLYYLWISNDNAFYDYSTNNADIDKNTLSILGGAKTYKIHLTKGEYYGLRVHAFSSQSIVGAPFSIYDPEGKLIDNTTDTHQFFNVLTIGNEIFYRKLQYFALYKNVSSSAGYLCLFVNPTNANYELIKKHKNILPYMYKKVVIPTPITYESFPYTVVASESDKPAISCPKNAQITIIEATWGTNPIQINEPKFETREHSDPNIIINRDTTTYEWQTSTAVFHNTENRSVTGIYFAEYDGGNSGAQPGWYQGRTPSNDSNIYSANIGGVTISDINDKYCAKSSFFTGYIEAYPGRNSGHYNRDNIHTYQVILKSSNGPSRLYIDTRDGRKQWYANNQTIHGDGAFFNNNGTRYAFQLYCGSNVTVKIEFKMYYDFKKGGPHRYGPRTLGSLSKYIGGGAGEYAWIKPINYQYVKNIYRNQVNTHDADVTTQTYILPLPTFEVEVPNLVTYEGNVNVTEQIRDLIHTPREANGNWYYDLDGNYESAYTPLLPNNIAKVQRNKELVIKYKFKIDLNTSQIDNLGIMSDETGQLVISYDYNDVSNNVQPISPALSQNQLCSNASECNYTITLEDDCSITTKSGGGVLAKKNIRELLDEKLQELNLPFESVLVNKKWRDDPYNIYSTLNNQQLLGNNEQITFLRSENGKYKLRFDSNSNLCLYFCVPVYETDNQIHYTTPSHANSDSKPFYYLYRPISNALTGHLVSTKYTESTNMRNLEIVPFTHTNILSDASSNSIPGYYPVLCNSSSINGECSTNLDYLLPATESQSGQGFIDNPKYVVFDVSNIEQCAQACLDPDSNCQHFFHINTRTGQKCIRDNVNNSVPLTTTTNPNSEIISSSSINTRMYKINSDCELGDTRVLPDQAKEYSNYQTLYNVAPPDKITGTYYCSDPEYWNVSDNINKFFSGSESFTNKSNIEAFDGNCGTAQCLINELDRIGNTRAAQFNEQQEKVGIMEDKINDQYDALGRNIQQVDLKTIQKEIPTKYTKKFYSLKPETNVRDIREKDSKEILVYENTLYTFATLSAATILITTIILMRD